MATLEQSNVQSKTMPHHKYMYIKIHQYFFLFYFFYIFVLCIVYKVFGGKRIYNVEGATNIKKIHLHYEKKSGEGA